MLEKLFTFLLGDDIFISYSRLDGATYAQGLANELASRNFSCRLDQWGTKSGSEMPESLKKALRRSAVLVLVGTEGAACSTHVADEVSAFKRKRDLIVPVIFDPVVIRGRVQCKNGKVYEAIVDKRSLPAPGASEDQEATWAADIEGVPPACESVGALESGNPSSNVVNRIEKTFTFNRKDQRMRKASAFAAAALVLMIGASVVAFSVALVKAGVAKRKSDEAANATRAADDAKLRAGQAGALADEKTRLADAETKRADEQKKKADDQKRIAEAAEARRLTAERGETAAKKRADKQELQARSNLAKNYYSQAQVEASVDPLRALVWAQKALETAPVMDERRGIYKMRAVNLTRSVPNSIVTVPGPIEFATFSPTNDKVITISPVQVWDLKTGERLPDPLSACKCSVGWPTFSPDGRWVAVLTTKESDSAKPDTDQTLHIWESATGGRHVTVHDERFSRLGSYLSFTPNSQAVMVERRLNNQDANELMIWSVLPALRELKPIPVSEKVTGMSPAKIVSRNPGRNWVITMEDGPAGRSAILRDISTGDSKPLIPPQAFFDFVDFTDDANEVITVTRDRKGEQLTLRVWNVASGKSSEPIPFADREVLGSSHDGQTLLVGDLQDKGLYLWKLSESQPRLLVKMDSWYSLYARFSADEKQVVTELRPENKPQFQINVFDVETGLLAEPPIVIPQQYHFRISPAMTLTMATTDGLVSVQSLRQRGGSNPLPTERIPHLNGQPFDDFYFTSDRQGLLTAYENSQNKFVGERPVQLWDLATGRALWKPGGVLVHSFRNPDFSPDGQLLVANETIASKSGFQIGAVIVRMMRDGEPVKAFQPIVGNYEAAKFTRDGSQIVTVKESRSGLTIEYWNALTGEQIKEATVEYSDAADAASITPWRREFHSLTRYGEYVITASNGTSLGTSLESKEFNVLGAGRGEKTNIHFRFLDEELAALSLALVTQAQRLRVEGETISAELNPGVSISLVASNGGATVSSRDAALQFLAPYTAIMSRENIRLSPDGRFVSTRDPRKQGKEVRIWETKTGLPVSDAMWHEATVASFEFTPDNQHVVTVTKSGKVRVWYIGSTVNNSAPWLAGMGEALSGMRLMGETEIKRIGQAQYSRIRNSFIELLGKAAHDDPDARFVLANWRQ